MNALHYKQHISGQKGSIVFVSTTLWKLSKKCHYQMCPSLERNKGFSDQLNVPRSSTVRFKTKTPVFVFHADLWGCPPFSQVSQKVSIDVIHRCVEEPLLVNWRMFLHFFKLYKLLRGPPDVETVRFTLWIYCVSVFKCLLENRRRALLLSGGWKRHRQAAGYRRPARLKHVQYGIVHLDQHSQVHRQAGLAVLGCRSTRQPREGVVLLQHKPVWRKDVQLSLL